MDPAACVAAALAARPGLPPFSLVVAVGKAAAGMMRGAHGAFSTATRSIVLIPRGTSAEGLPASTVVLHGGHPHPTAEGFGSARRILDEVDRLGAAHSLLFLVSGGASALFEVPGAGIDEDDLLRAYELLVTSGLSIAGINLVRGCLSEVKAGRLAHRARPAHVTTLAISDVEGDDPGAIGSGPTVPPPVSRSEAAARAIAIVRGCGLALPTRIAARLERDATTTGDERGRIEVPDFTVVASIHHALAGARRQLERRGYCVATSPEYLRGATVSCVAQVTTALQKGETARAALLGGETTVAVPAGAAGRGGRNLDLAARLALAIAGREDLAVVVAGTDGCDGSSRAAGAIVDGGTARRAEQAGFPLEAALAAFDTEPAIEAAGDLVVTGPTGTNVGDLVVAVAAPEPTAGPA